MLFVILGIIAGALILRLLVVLMKYKALHNIEQEQAQLQQKRITLITSYRQCVDDFIQRLKSLETLYAKCPLSTSPHLQHQLVLVRNAINFHKSQLNQLELPSPRTADSILAQLFQCDPERLYKVGHPMKVRQQKAMRDIELAMRRIAAELLRGPVQVEPERRQVAGRDVRKLR